MSRYARRLEYKITSLGRTSPPAQASPVKVEIILLDIHTGAPHTGAANPTIPVASFSSLDYGLKTIMEVSGDYVILSLSNFCVDVNTDNVYLIDWKTGDTLWVCLYEIHENLFTHPFLRICQSLRNPSQEFHFWLWIASCSYILRTPVYAYLKSTNTEHTAPSYRPDH